MTAQVAKLWRPIASPLTRRLSDARRSTGRYSGASMFLDFALDHFYADGLGDEWADIGVITRATGGGRINAAGQYEWLGPDTLRRTYDPVTLQPLGLLIEEQRTNLIRHSANLANVAWSRGVGVSISTDGQLAPDGTPMQLITLAGTTNHNINQVLLAPLATGQAHTISVYVKPKSAPFPFQIAYYDGSSSLNSVLITPQPGVIQRIDFTFTPTVVAASPQIRIIGFGAGGDGDQVYIWGVQSEQASAPSTYIPTEASQVTRAADVCSVNTLSPWFNAGEFSVVCEFIPAAGLTGFRNVVTMGSGAGNTMFMSLAAAGVTVGGVASTTPGLSGVPATIKSAMACKVGSPTTYARNGELRTAPTNMTSPAVFTTLALGRATTYSGDFYNGTISRLTVYPRVIDVQQASA